VRPGVCPTQNGKLDPDPPPPPPPAATDRWIDNVGNVFTVDRSGNSISGRGNMAGWGPVTFTGALEGTANMYNASGTQIARLQGGTDGDPVGGHWNGTLYSFGDGQTYSVTFHINHTPR
jgi:hypothetical protein